MILIAAVLVLFCTYFVDCASPSEWKSKAIYQLLTDRFAESTDKNSSCPDLAKYCGGTFQGIINHFDYISDLGFDAVWISPVIENIPWTSGDMEAYHGYWAYNFYEINSHFGTEADLLNLANILHSNDSYLMIDIVCNHVGYTNGNNNFEGFVPFNDSSHYHSCDSPCTPGCGIADWTCNAQTTSLQAQICRLSGLPDLNQTNSFVNEALLSWGKQYIVKKWLADGMRIDTVEEVNQEFWAQFQKNVDVYTVGEVDNGNSQCTGKYQSDLDGILNYPLYYQIDSVFGGDGGFNALSYQIKKNRIDFNDTTLLGNFIDNHDNNRFLCDYPAQDSQHHMKYINALTFILTFEGIPIIYYGTEQAFNGCKNTNDGSGSREILWTAGYNATATDIGRALMVVNNARKIGKIWNFQFVELQTNANLNNFYAYNRGDSFLVLVTNVGYEDNKNRTYQVLNPGIQVGVTYCNVFTPKNDCFVYKKGTLDVTLYQGAPKIYVPQNHIINNYSNQLQVVDVFGHSSNE